MTQGIHYQGKINGRCLGEEVMVDTYLATKAAAFMGNGFSNPSVMVGYLKEWSDGACVLLGRNSITIATPLFMAVEDCRYASLAVFRYRNSCRAQNLVFRMCLRQS